jgi:SAM-dependent methyltransferase
METIELLDKLNSNKGVDTEIDSHFYLNQSDIEEKVIGENEHLYQGVRPEALYTSYQDLWNIFQRLDLKEGEAFVDVGAGVGRSKFLLETFYPMIKSFAVELSPERVNASIKAARRSNISTNGFYCQDLSKTKIQVAQYYFFYMPYCDFIERSIEHILNYAQSEKRTLIMIESHGDFLYSFNKHFGVYFELKEKVPLTSQRHDEFAYIFETRSPDYIKKLVNLENEKLKNYWRKLLKENVLPFKELSEREKHLFLRWIKDFQDYFIEVRDDDGKLWLADGHELELSLKSNYYRCKHSEREFHTDHISKVLFYPEMLEKVLLTRRKKLTVQGGYFVRKVIIWPEMMVELSNSKRIPLSNIKFDC